MSVLVCDYQNETEAEEDDEAEMSRPEIQLLNRQASMR